jgi:UDP-N-acetylmuramoyl-tripeptide--D-alanyl-D-alanine ligase
VGITGTNGKTTTKEMVASICERAGGAPGTPGPVLKTAGNFNNLIGLPLTLLGQRGDEAVAVLEMGMNAPGEIARLTEIAQPDYGVIVNVGPGHLAGVGGVAGVARAKGELFAHAAAGAVMAINTDDPWVQRLAPLVSGPKIFFGCAGEIRARHVVDLGVDGVGFDLWVGRRRARVRLPLLGQHNVSNALAAAALTYAMGHEVEAIAAGLEHTTAPPRRLRVRRTSAGVVVLDDTYNANPSSVQAALEVLSRRAGKQVVVLGDMRELGDESRRAHREIGARVASLGVARLVVLGAEAQAVADGARAAGLPAAAVIVAGSHREAAEAAVAELAPGDTVLVKGSRGMRMEEIVTQLVASDEVL